MVKFIRIIRRKQYGLGWNVYTLQLGGLRCEFETDEDYWYAVRLNNREGIFHR